MPRKFLILLTLAVLIASSSVNAQRRNVFDWPWGMSCAQIERQYGETEASAFTNLEEEVTYPFNFLGQALEVKYWCKGRGLIWGDGELTAIYIIGYMSSIKVEEIMSYCGKVAGFLQNKYGKITNHLDKRGPYPANFGVSYFYEAERINTKVHLFCQERFGGDRRSKFMTIDITRINRYM